MTRSSRNVPASARVSSEAPLASRYRVDEVLGEGGMGVVHAGEHLELKTRVAIKFLQPALANDEQARARFVREARLAASIGGDHSVRIHDVGSDAGRPYIVMEYLEGEAASARLARDGHFPVLEATTLVIQLLDAVAEAHAKGLVHRDLKPANLFLVNKPGEPIWVKVLDFGISKASTSDDRSQTTLTGPQTILGSPEYMSPEQLRDSATVDARSDIWACGVVLFELLSGRTPFGAASLPDLYARIVAQAPRTLSGGADSVPGPVLRMIERCLRKEPDERPQSVYELAVALAPYANDSARALLPRIKAWCKSDLPVPEARRPWRTTLGGMSLIAAAGIMAFAAASTGGGERTRRGLASAPSAVPLDPLPVAPSPAAPPSVEEASSSSSRPPAGSAPRPRRTPAGPVPPREPSRRAPDLDGIDLIP